MLFFTRYPLIFVTLLCTVAQAQVTEAEYERLLERQGTFLDALAAKDADAAAAHFAEDAMLHVANMSPVRGREAIHTFYSNVFRFMLESEATPETLQISASGDMAYTTGSVTNSFQGQDEPMRYSGKYLLVWENHDGEWLISVYAVSNNSGEER